MSNDGNYQDLRRSYVKHTLDRSDLNHDPLDQFKAWFAQLNPEENFEANAMVLSTVNAVGKPSSRVMLLKEVAEGGFIFYTNYNSRKGQEIRENRYVSLVFWWPALERQVRIEGVIRQYEEAPAKAYFQTRPRGSQLGAWASPQSQAIDNREVLEKALEELEKKYPEGSVVPKPNHWGGYIVIPEVVEFWQGRADRLHDRFTYTRHGERWKIQRLAP